MMHGGAGCMAGWWAQRGRRRRLGRQTYVGRADVRGFGDSRGSCGGRCVVRRGWARCTGVERVGAVSYTHLRAHETLMNL
eukprot:6752799-Prymnesium_polylepis.2